MSSALDTLRDRIATAVAAAPVPSGDPAYLHHTEPGRPSGVSAHRRFWCKLRKGSPATEYGASATGSGHTGELHVVLRTAGRGTAAVWDLISDAQRCLIDALNHDVTAPSGITAIIPQGYDTLETTDDVELVIIFAALTLEEAT